MWVPGDRTICPGGLCSGDLQGFGGKGCLIGMNGMIVFPHGFRALLAAVIYLVRKMCGRQLGT